MLRGRHDHEHGGEVSIISNEHRHGSPFERDEPTNPERNAFTRLVQSAANDQLRQLESELRWKLAEVQLELVRRGK